MDITAYLQISYPISNVSDDPIVTLSLTDKASGECVFRADIPAADWAIALGRNGCNVTGVMTSHVERFGRTIATDSRYLGREATPEQQRAAKAEALANGWETAEIRRSNRGPKLVMRAWPANDVKEG